MSLMEKVVLKLDKTRNRCNEKWWKAREAWTATRRQRHYWSSVTPRKRVVVMVVPAVNVVSGGLISIFSIGRESRAVGRDMGFDVQMCVPPGSVPFSRNTRFVNDETIVTLDQVMARYDRPEALWIHVAASMAKDFYASLGERHQTWIRGATRSWLNVLNQNIDLMPGPDFLHGLKSLFTDVTVTASNIVYMTQSERDRLGVPLHRLSIYLDHRDYEKRGFARKKDIIVISPDRSPHKEAFLAMLEAKYPWLGRKIVQRMSYEAYKKLVVSARWSITFGEGFDNYFREMIFTGGIGFTVFKPQFFPKAFKGQTPVFDSYEDLLARFSEVFEKLHADPELYARENTTLLQLLNGIYNRDEYRANIRRYYQENYDYK